MHSSASRLTAATPDHAPLRRIVLHGMPICCDSGTELALFAPPRQAGLPPAQSVIGTTLRHSLSSLVQRGAAMLPGRGKTSVLWALALTATALLVMRVVRSVRAPRVDVLESAILPPRAFRRWVEASSSVESGPVNEIPLDRFAGRGRGRRTAARVPGDLDREAKQVKRAPCVCPPLNPCCPLSRTARPTRHRGARTCCGAFAPGAPAMTTFAPHASGARGVHAAVQKA